MYQKEPISIKNDIVIPNRSTSILYHRYPKKKSYRTPLENHIHMYNQIPAESKMLKPKTYAKKLKKVGFDYKPLI